MIYPPSGEKTPFFRERETLALLHSSPSEGGEVLPVRIQEIKKSFKCTTCWRGFPKVGKILIIGGGVFSPYFGGQEYKGTRVFLLFKVSPCFAPKVVEMPPALAAFPLLFCPNLVKCSTQGVRHLSPLHTFSIVQIGG